MTWCWKLAYPSISCTSLYLYAGHVKDKKAFIFIELPSHIIYHEWVCAWTLFFWAIQLQNTPFLGWGGVVSLFPNLSQPSVYVCQDNQHRIHYCGKKPNIIVLLTKRINSRVINTTHTNESVLFLYFSDKGSAPTGHHELYRTEWQYHMLHVYNCVLLKMSTKVSKHVEEYNILWIIFYIKTVPTCFGSITTIRERIIWACYSYSY